MDRSQGVKLAIAIGVLVLAAGLIIYQTGLFASEPPPLAAGAAAAADDDQNPDNPGVPPPKSNFSRRPTLAKP
jgi:hypothetical protein